MARIQSQQKSFLDKSSVLSNHSNYIPQRYTFFSYFVQTQNVNNSWTKLFMFTIVYSHFCSRLATLWWGHLRLPRKIDEIMRADFLPTRSLNQPRAILDKGCKKCVFTENVQYFASHPSSLPSFDVSVDCRLILWRKLCLSFFWSSQKRKGTH